jgi:hypothetical protein
VGCDIFTVMPCRMLDARIQLSFPGRFPAVEAMPNPRQAMSLVRRVLLKAVPQISRQGHNLCVQKC